jgi:hypothetical protein
LSGDKGLKGIVILTALMAVFDTSNVESLSLAEDLALGRGQVVEAAQAMIESSDVIDIITPASALCGEP